MKSQTLKKLRAIAKQHGVKGFHNLSKTQLVDAIKTIPQKRKRQRKLLNSAVPEINVPILQPTAYVPPHHHHNK